MTTSIATMKPEEVYTKEEVDAMIAAAVAEAHEADRILMAKHNKTWYPEWDSKERWAAQRALNNALDVLDEFDY